MSKPVAVTKTTVRRALDPPEGGRHFRGLSPFPKEGRICSANVRIPGPNAPAAAALTPNASTSVALVPEHSSVTHPTPSERARRLPPQMVSRWRGFSTLTRSAVTAVVLGPATRAAPSGLHPEAQDRRFG